MATEHEQAAMERAITEAMRSRPSPNPRVGAVVLDDGAVVAVGHHERAGEAHAEVNAIRNASGKTRGATLVVTLEPCNHTGRTGPCTEAIIEAGFARVVIGCRDPAPHVPGAVERLEQAGIEVEIGVLEPEATALVADFAKHIQTGLPHVTLKAAVTLYGKMATRTGDSRWITGQEARTEAHRMRAETDAVLVGIGTVLADDPALTVRHVEGVDPLRVVLDAALRTPPNAAILAKGQRSTVIFHAPDAASDRHQALAQAGADLVQVDRAPAGVSLFSVLKELGRRDIVRLLVEGGAMVHGSFLDEGIADKVAIFIAPIVLGDRDAPSFAFGRGADTIASGWRVTHSEVVQLGEDVLIQGQLERS